MNKDRWLGVELRHLAALRAIAREGSFRAAADELGYVQSAVSQQIQMLERIVGATLVERPGGPRPVSLTAEGELLLYHARGILARLAAAKADLEDMRAPRGEAVAVGMCPGLATVLVPRIAPAFALVCPTSNVTVTEALGDQPILRAIEAGGLDIGIVSRSTTAGRTAPSEHFVWCELMRSAPVLVGGERLGPGGLRPAADPRRPRSRTADRARVLSRLQRPRAVPADLDRRRGRRGPDAERRDRPGLCAERGLGVAAMARLEVDATDPCTTILDLASVLPDVSISLVWHRERVLSRAAESFGEATRTVCRELHRAKPPPVLAA